MRRRTAYIPPGAHRTERIARPMIPPGVAGLQRGPNIVVDGDMEAVGIGAWSVLNSTVTKVLDGANRILQIEGIGSPNSAAYQTILTGGLSYRISGRLRSDGVYKPWVETTLGSKDVFEATLSTSW